jgi:hypothetical protein
LIKSRCSPPIATAAEFFRANQRDGRALLRGVPRLRKPREMGASSAPERGAWLIRLGRRLFLCNDSEYPVQRRVPDDAPVYPHYRGGYRL